MSAQRSVGVSAFGNQLSPVTCHMLVTCRRPINPPAELVR